MKSLMLGSAGALMLTALAGCQPQAPAPQATPAETPPVAEAQTLSGLSIECARGQSCTPQGQVAHSQPNSPKLKRVQRLNVADADEANVPPHDHAMGVSNTGTHCWVQLPSGQWQLYHC